MYITQESDYAIRIIYCLAKHDRRCDAKFIGEDMGVSLRFCLKILGKLSQHNLVNSFKGNKGGYELARPANEINVNDVITAIEGSYKISRCVADETACNRNATNYCTIHKLFTAITIDVTEVLKSATFDKLIKG